MNTVVVVDANVVAKTFLSEADAPDTIKFFTACVAEKLQVIAPDIVKYEVAQTAMKHCYPVGRVMNIFRDQLSTLIDMQSPEGEVWEQAEAICQHGHPKSGYPTMYDSIYHAMAIVEDGLFITADKRHYEKAKTFGHIALLSNWQAALKGL